MIPWDSFHDPVLCELSSITKLDPRKVDLKNLRLLAFLFLRNFQEHQFSFWIDFIRLVVIGPFLVDFTVFVLAESEVFLADLFAADFGGVLQYLVFEIQDGGACRYWVAEHGVRHDFKG